MCYNEHGVSSINNNNRNSSKSRIMIAVLLTVTVECKFLISHMLMKLCVGASTKYVKLLFRFFKYFCYYSNLFCYAIIFFAAVILKTSKDISS